METKHIEFAKLKHAYIVVKQFLETEGYEKVNSLKDNVEGDLGLSGDDNLELLENFVKKFELSYRGFNYEKHFYSEGELSNPASAFLSLINLSIWLPLKTIELVTLNKIKIEKPSIRTTPDRTVNDLTFRELITWYIEKEYIEKNRIKYEIKH